MMIFFSSFLLSVCEFYSVDSAMYMPNAVKGRFSFRNCNNTPVPLIFDHVDIQPDPVQMDLGYVNLNMSATLTKMIGYWNKVDASLSVRLKTSNGETELCYIIGGQCYVSDLCYFIKTTLNIPTCTIEPFQGNFLNRARQFEHLPFIVKGQFTIKANVRELGEPVACLEWTMCLNDCSLL
ncbi:uncharacterized protein LOC128228647 [Mya arenaria]|uniref:uncharacterized protein LOC128228647 n=1 Tax=Mya arenaria TaxID=6604 RepID=UPI0022E0EBB9|nr:uncharacterized protein LOC128228647 [Mya arenaria]